MKEIGSEYWLDSVNNNFIRKEMPLWLSRFGEVTLTSSGRGAISLLLQNIEPKTKTALLPSYICESVIDPFRRFGYDCYFYEVNRNLSIDFKTIMEFKDIGVFVHMGYFGFNTNRKIMEQIKILQERSTIVIEDVTHNLFYEYLTLDSDFYIASIRKWFGTPTGGFLATNNKKMKIQTHLKENRVLSNLRLEALKMKAEYIHNDNENIKEKVLNEFSRAEALLDSDPSAYKIDNVSSSIIENIDIENIIIKRRMNFNALLEGILRISYIEPIFTSLENDTCPFFFPVYLKKGRDYIRRILIENSIYCPIHWPMPRDIGYENKKIYEKILSIPCDQRYETSDMSRIIELLRTVNIGDLV